MVWLLCIVGLSVICSLCCFLLVALEVHVRRMFRHRVTRKEMSEKIKTLLLRVNIAIVLLFGFSIITNAYPVLTQDISSETGGKQQIHTLDDDKEKGIDDIFSQNSGKEVEEAVQSEIDKHLHMEWADEGLNYQGYGKKIADLYFITPHRKDKSYERQSEEAKIIKECNETIREIQEKRRSGAVITEEELQEERQAYWQSFQIRPVARMAYQAGRSSEDIFWGQSNVDEKLRESGADAIYSFETFLKFENREVGEGEEKRVVCVEEILFRNGKTFFRLGIATEDTKQRTHYLLCAYALFSNVNLEGEDVLNSSSINEYVMLAEYYKGLTIANLPLDVIDSTLLNELKCSMEISSELLARNANLEEELKQNEELNMPERLEELREAIPRVEKWTK